MRDIKLTHEQRLLIEELGKAYEKLFYITPSEGRVAALLIVSDVPDLTFEEISEALKLSKGATSQAVKILLKMKKIEYHTKPGDRKRYFTSRIGKNFEQIFSDREEASNMLAKAMKKTLDQRPKDTADFNLELKRMVAMLDFFSKEIPLMAEKWKKENNIE